MVEQHKSVVLDGPAGVGKSTIAKALARRLGYQYIDTGAMYRTAALLALENDIPPQESGQEEITRLVLAQPFVFVFDGPLLRVFHGDREVTEDIRTGQVSYLVSPVSALPEVRRGLTEVQRKMAARGNVVMEGRDIGTVVLPNATYKFFLIAEDAIRADRRYQELQQKGVDISPQQVRKDLARRDYLDSTRKLAPLQQAKDAIVVDTSNMSIEEVIDCIIAKTER